MTEHPINIKLSERALDLAEHHSEWKDESLDEFIERLIRTEDRHEAEHLGLDTCVRRRLDK